MRTRLAVIATALVLTQLGDPALAQARRQALPVEGAITNPDWESRPSGELMARYYPQFAQAANLSGYAIITCQVTNLGRLEDCTASDEKPAMMGFGQAALSLSREFKMKPKTLDGVPVAGGVVRIPISFAYPGPRNPDFAGSASPPSPTALVAAHGIVDAAGGRALYQNGLIQTFDRQAAMIQATSPTSDPQATQQLKAAVDKAAAAAATARYDAMTQAVLETFSEKELNDIAAFMKTASGKAFASKQADLNRAMARLSDTPAVANSFSREFCRAEACVGAQAAPAVAQAAQDGKP